jgi:hypothetical protein
MMIGAKDLAFPRLNLASWYVFIIGGIFTLAAMIIGGVDTGWTFYTPYSSVYSNTHVVMMALGVIIAGSRRFSPASTSSRRSIKCGRRVSPGSFLHLVDVCDQHHLCFGERRCWRWR